MFKHTRVGITITRIITVTTTMGAETNINIYRRKSGGMWCESIQLYGITENSFTGGKVVRHTCLERISSSGTIYPIVRAKWSYRQRRSLVNRLVIINNILRLR